MVNHGEEGAFLHLTPEKLRDGTIIEVDSPGTELHRRPVTVYSVLTHPVDGRPGIAYGRGSAFDAEAGGRTELPTKGVPSVYAGNGRRAGTPATAWNDT